MLWGEKTSGKSSQMYTKKTRMRTACAKSRLISAMMDKIMLEGSDNRTRKRIRIKVSKIT